jgi:hypothetical protein
MRQAFTTNLKRTQMYFPLELLITLRRKAHLEKTTIASIVRLAVLDLIKKEKLKDWVNDPLWNIIGASYSSNTDLSINHDKYLYGRKK